MKKQILKSILVIVATLLLAACKKDDNNVVIPVNTNEEELITTVKLLVTIPFMNARTEEYVFRDIDGDGGNPPTIDTLRLAANVQYEISVIVLNESSNPVDSISKEIIKEKNDHQFFYLKTGTYDLTTTYLDFDDNHVPLGTWIQLNTTSGFTEKTNTFRVVLKHQPGLKPTSGNGDIKLGESDIDISFPIIIRAN